MNDYKVAAHPRGPARSHVAGQPPEGKLHAYLQGATTTACGFGIDRMQRFDDLRFSLMAPSVRCPLCARVVGADH